MFELKESVPQQDKQQQDIKYDYKQALENLENIQSPQLKSQTPAIRRRSYVRQLACIKPHKFREKGNFKNDLEIRNNYLTLLYGEKPVQGSPIDPSNQNWVRVLTDKMVKDGGEKSLGLLADTLSWLSHIGGVNYYFEKEELEKYLKRIGSAGTTIRIQDTMRGELNKRLGFDLNALQLPVKKEQIQYLARDFVNKPKHPTQDCSLQNKFYQRDAQYQTSNSALSQRISYEGRQDTSNLRIKKLKTEGQTQEQRQLLDIMKAVSYYSKQKQKEKQNDPQNDSIYIKQMQSFSQNDEQRGGQKQEHEDKGDFTVHKSDQTENLTQCLLGNRHQPAYNLANSQGQDFKQINCTSSNAILQKAVQTKDDLNFYTKQIYKRHLVNINHQQNADVQSQANLARKNQDPLQLDINNITQEQAYQNGGKAQIFQDLQLQSLNNSVPQQDKQNNTLSVQIQLQNNQNETQHGSQASQIEDALKGPQQIKNGGPQSLYLNQGQLHQTASKILSDNTLKGEQIFKDVHSNKSQSTQSLQGLKSQNIRNQQPIELLPLAHLQEDKVEGTKNLVIPDLLWQKMSNFQREQQNNQQQIVQLQQLIQQMAQNNVTPLAEAQVASPENNVDSNISIVNLNYGGKDNGFANYDNNADQNKNNDNSKKANLSDSNISQQNYIISQAPLQDNQQNPKITQCNTHLVNNDRIDRTKLGTGNNDFIQQIKNLHANPQVLQNNVQNLSNHGVVDKISLNNKSIQDMIPYQTLNQSLPLVLSKNLPQNVSQNTLQDQFTNKAQNQMFDLSQSLAQQNDLANSSPICQLTQYLKYQVQSQSKGHLSDDSLKQVIDTILFQFRQQGDDLNQYVKQQQQQQQQQLLVLQQQKLQQHLQQQHYQLQQKQQEQQQQQQQIQEQQQQQQQQKQQQQYLQQQYLKLQLQKQQQVQQHQQLQQQQQQLQQQQQQEQQQQQQQQHLQQFQQQQQQKQQEKQQQQQHIQHQINIKQYQKVQLEQQQQLQEQSLAQLNNEKHGQQQQHQQQSDQQQQYHKLQQQCQQQQQQSMQQQQQQQLQNFILFNTCSNNNTCLPNVPPQNACIEADLTQKVSQSLCNQLPNDYDLLKGHSGQHNLSMKVDRIQPHHQTQITSGTQVKEHQTQSFLEFNVRGNDQNSFLQSNNKFNNILQVLQELKSQRDMDLNGSLAPIQQSLSLCKSQSENINLNTNTSNKLDACKLDINSVEKTIQGIVSSSQGLSNLFYHPLDGLRGGQAYQQTNKEPITIHTQEIHDLQEQINQLPSSVHVLHRANTDKPQSLSNMQLTDVQLNQGQQIKSQVDLKVQKNADITTAAITNNDSILSGCKRKQSNQSNNSLAQKLPEIVGMDECSRKSSGSINSKRIRNSGNVLKEDNQCSPSEQQKGSSMQIQGNCQQIVCQTHIQQSGNDLYKLKNQEVTNCGVSSKDLKVVQQQEKISKSVIFNIVLDGKTKEIEFVGIDQDNENIMELSIQQVLKKLVNNKANQATML